MTTPSKEEANVEQAVPGFWVHDINQSVRFYTEGLGFKLTNQWVHEGKLRWCRLDLGNVTVMLQEFWKEGDDYLSEGKVGIGVGICFFCRDAVALWREFVSRGIAAKRPFVGNGLWVTEIEDPDGYKLFFESPTTWLRIRYWNELITLRIWVKSRNAKSPRLGQGGVAAPIKQYREASSAGADGAVVRENMC